MAEQIAARVRGRLETVVVFLLVAFLVVFPKGGFKVAGIPITWGYLLLFATAAVLAVTNLSHGFTTTRKRWLVIAASIPFQAFVVFVLVFYGFVSLGFAMSIIVSLVVMPWIFVIVFGNYFERARLDYLMDLLRKGLLLVALYGIFLFIYRLLTGDWIEIPFLTINYGDLGGLDYKHINRGGIFKLISTYNNGNIYGVCVLMLLPLYERLEKKGWKVWIVKASLLLTLSRTVWIGLIIYELAMQFYIRREFSRTVLRQLVILLVGLAGLLSVMYFIMGQNLGFLLDANLGGRVSEFGILQNFTFFPPGPYHVIAEVVYMSILRNLGLLGLILFLLMMVTTIVLNLDAGTPLKRALLAGAVLYLMLAMSDGAIMFIPVMAIYWFVVSLLISRNPDLN